MTKEEKKTMDELDEFKATTLDFMELSYEDCTKNHRYERESVYFKDTWKRVKNILDMYGTKLVHFGDFTGKYGMYIHEHNVIAVRPLNSFINSCEHEDLDIFPRTNYYKARGTTFYYHTLCHELCHLILEEEFLTTLLLGDEAEEIIVESVCRDVMLKDICPNDANGKYSSFYDEFREASDNYIEKYKRKILNDNRGRKFWRESDVIRLYEFTDDVKERVKEIWMDAAPAGKKKVDMVFESSLNQVNINEL